MHGTAELNAAASLAVVVPVLDDAGALAALLADLQAQRGVTLQVVVADGGSADDSVEVARQAGATVVRCAPGRGHQMNAGAAAARGDWLCFLHADSRLTHPDQLGDGLARLAGAADADRVAGHFALRFVRRDARHARFYRFLEAKSASSRRYSINGDQGLMLRRAFFERLGGFDDRLPFLEDQRMAAAIARDGRWCLLEHRLATSARRFEVEGVARRYALMALIMAMYVADVPAFFARAPDVYRVQARSRRLALMPYLRLVDALRREGGVAASLAAAWRVADLAACQRWQLGLVFNVARGSRRARVRPSAPSRRSKGWSYWPARIVAWLLLVVALYGVVPVLAAFGRRA